MKENMELEKTAEIPAQSMPFQGQKKSTIVISDIHMGDQRSLDQNYGWFKDNKATFLDFLEYVIKNADGIKELVIAGDLLDEWVAPMDVKTFADERGNPLTQSQFVGKIVEANREVVDKLKEIYVHGIKIVYTPGNHDMLVTPEDFDTYFGKGVVTQARDARGLGRYEPSDDIVIEHGHRYDYFNAPDPLSNRKEGVNDDTILPPGFFISKIASTSDKKGQSINQGKFRLENLDAAVDTKENPIVPSNPEEWEGYLDKLVERYLGEGALCSDKAEPKKTPASVDGRAYDNWALLSAAWFMVHNNKPVSVKPIMTGIDGYLKNYDLEQVSFWMAKWFGTPILYVDSYERSKWTERLEKNNVKGTDLWFKSGVLAGAIVEIYPLIAFHEYKDSWKNKRIIIFGHTHAGVVWKNDNAIYANSGTWVDDKWAEKGAAPRTFLQIDDLTNEQGKGTKSVTLYSFVSKGNIKRLESEKLKYE